MKKTTASPVLMFSLLTILVVGLSVVAVIAPEEEPNRSSVASQIVGAFDEATRGDNESQVRDKNDDAELSDLRPQPGEHPLDPVLTLARSSLKKLQTDVQDYTAQLLKRERINGKLAPENVMEIKVLPPRLQPDGMMRKLHVYLKFIAPKSAAGREVIWVDGENNGNLIAHEGGFLNVMRVPLAPDGMMAMNGNKYPINDIGLDNLIVKLIEKGERDKALGPCEVNIIDNQIVGNRRCRLIEVVHPEKEPKWEFYKAQIYFDVDQQIPLRYAAYMWPEKAGGDVILDEEYTYTDLKLNVGLTTEDFNPDNPAYKYP